MNGPVHLYATNSRMVVFFAGLVAGGTVLVFLLIKSSNYHQQRVSQSCLIKHVCAMIDFQFLLRVTFLLRAVFNCVRAV